MDSDMAEQKPNQDVMRSLLDQHGLKGVLDLIVAVADTELNKKSEGHQDPDDIRHQKMVETNVGKMDEIFLKVKELYPSPICDTETMVQIRTCSYVEASDLFAGLADLWTVYGDSSPRASWGDNNRTLNKAGDIYEHLKRQDDVNEEHLQTFKERVDSIGEETYVDLEN